MKTAFVFPGQGSQTVGMGRDLSNNFPEAAEIFATADRALGFKISTLCFEGPDAELGLTANTQPAILTVSIAALAVLTSRGIHAEMTAGHSLGEYAALVAAGVFSFADAVKLVRLRGQFMQETARPGTSGMAAVLGLENAKVVRACEEALTAGHVAAANYNSPGQVVISGELAALETAMELAKTYGAKRVVQLPVNGPFHTKLMVPAGERLAAELAKTSICEPSIPVVTNISARPLQGAGAVSESLVSQVSGPVRWEETVNYMVEKGITRFIELGPGKVLSGLIRKISREVEVFNVEDSTSLEKTLAKLGEVG